MEWSFFVLRKKFPLEGNCFETGSLEVWYNVLLLVKKETHHGCRERVNDDNVDT